MLLHLRKLTPLALALLIVPTAGCTNLVITAEPLFARGGHEAPTLKPGIWRLTQVLDPDREANPLTLRIGDDRLNFLDSESGEPSEASPNLSFLVIPGEPLLAQVTNDVQIDGRPENRGVSAYFALQPLERDETGRVVSIAAWVVQCGPPPEKGDPNHGVFGEKGWLTSKPFPGLRMTGNTCEPADLADIESLRNAARLGMAVAEDRIDVQWAGD